MTAPTASAVPDILRAGPALRLLRDQSGPPLLRGRAPLRQPAQRLLAAAGRLGPDAAAARPVGAMVAPRPRVRAHERRFPDDQGKRRPAPRRLRGVARAARAAGRRAPAAGGSRSSGSRRTRERWACRAVSSASRSARSKRRASSSCPRPRPRTRPCPTRSGCGGSRRSRRRSPATGRFRHALARDPARSACHTRVFRRYARKRVVGEGCPVIKRGSRGRIGRES